MKTSLISDFTYGYDAANRINVEMRGQDSKGDAYFYDKLGRLTNATRDSDNPFAEITTPGSTNYAFQREWLMDDDSHRSAVKTTPMGGATATDTYAVSGVRHHYDNITLDGQPATTRAFDLDGRLTRHGTRYFDYDCVDNLIKVRDGHTTVGEYLFDALGRRVKKTAEGWDNHFINAGPWVIEDYRRVAGGGSAWQLKGSYVHGPGIDNVVMMRHRDWVDADTDTDKVEPQNLFLHQNHLGSTMELTGPTGAVVESYRYDAYGKVTVLDANGAVLPAAVAGNSFLFTGREYDWESGLYHYRSRAYDPSTGSFLQEDPLGMRDGVNVCAYVNANPVNLSDPFGTSGVGETISNIMSFINNNRALVADLLVDLMGPLEGILDLISAVTGKDITGWLRGGMKGSPESMGWWDRGCAAAGAAIKIASGGLRLLGKLKSILKKIEKVVEKAMEQAANVARHAACPLVGGCFVAGTLVSMSDGELVPIERVVEGAVVESAIPPACPSMAVTDCNQVATATWARRYWGALHTVVLEGANGERAEVSGTPEHQFWVVSSGCWRPMSALVVGVVLDGLRGPVRVVDHQVDFVDVEVFNLTVDRTHSYRVSPIGVLVHNVKRYKRKPNPGVYEIHYTDGSTYVGQSNDMHRRFGEHRRAGKFVGSEGVTTYPIPGTGEAGQLARNQAERALIRSHGGVGNLRNINNAPRN